MARGLSGQEAMNVHYEVRQRVAVIQIDNPPVNGLGHAVRKGIAEGIERALDDPTVDAIVITGTGRVFSGGADIREFNTPAMVAPPTLLDLIVAAESAFKPVISAINGVCMGGGLELSLACHYRVATPKASMGLPESKIGLIPGAGGTQRLPRAVGAALALRMITRGDPIRADQALDAGLIARVVPDTTFDGVLAFAHEIAAARPLPRLRDRGVALPEGVPTAQFFARARAEVASRARGLTAPLRCVDAIEDACTLPFEQGLANERAIFIERVQSAESKALRHAFFAERAAARIADVPESTPLRDIQTVGVIGFGTMGSGIALALIAAGLPVRVAESAPQALDRGLAACRAQWQADVRKGRLSEQQVKDRERLLTRTTSIEDLAGCDLVIEAAFEDIDVKRDIFRKLDRVMETGAILATNTSTLDVDAIAAVTGRPQDVIGLHFFSPAQLMRLLEVVRGARTGKDVLATAMQFARRIGKVAVVSGVCDGFIGNRMLEQYIRQSLFLVDEGASPQQIDGALTRFGLAMGPFAMYDMAGMDVGYAIRQRRYRERPDLTYSRIADKIVEAGRIGQKCGKGWYRYTPPDRTPLPDDEVDRMIADWRSRLGRASRRIDDAEIVDRCLLALVNEGARLLEEGVAQRASDIDIVYLTGYGFPPAQGGPMFWAQQRGFDAVLARMREFAASPHADPAFWTPAPLLQQAAQAGRWPR
jgi:3-hydroxyacyl-CoA dehydrogenase